MNRRSVALAMTVVGLGVLLSGCVENAGYFQPAYSYPDYGFGGEGRLAPWLGPRSLEWRWPRPSRATPVRAMDLAVTGGSHGDGGHGGGGRR